MEAELSGIPPMFYITFKADESLEINSPPCPGFSGAGVSPFSLKHIYNYLES
ncbi:MAG: hypothetical protein NDI81_05130 [Desulfobacula sp.]|nr:hypothetical protein [Desulfobacula sp.]